MAVDGACRFISRERKTRVSENAARATSLPASVKYLSIRERHAPEYPNQFLSLIRPSGPAHRSPPPSPPPLPPASESRRCHRHPRLCSRNMLISQGTWISARWDARARIHRTRKYGAYERIAEIACPIGACTLNVLRGIER